MTPSERMYQSQRKWTPRLLSASTVLSAGGIILWFFVSSWVLDIKTSIQKTENNFDNLNTLIAERHTSAEIWRTATTDRINYIDGRLALVENKIDK